MIRLLHALALALALALLTPAALAAEPGPGFCNNAGCVRSADTDEDGSLDWVSVGTGGEFHGVNVIWRGGEELWTEAVVNTDDHEEYYQQVWWSGHVHYGDEHHRHADGCVSVMQVSGPHGTEEYWAWNCSGVEVPHDVHPPHPHLP